MRRLFVLSIAVLTFAATPHAETSAARSDAGKECLRIAENPNDAPWGEQERAYKAWLEICEKAAPLERDNMEITRALARAHSATGDHDAAIALWRKMAAKNDADAFYNLFEEYKSFERGDVAKTHRVGREEAERALRRAAELGNPDATLMLAALLDRGGVVKRNPAEAIRWAERAVLHPPRDNERIDMETLLGGFLVKSGDASDRARGVALLEKLGRGDAKAELARALRKDNPARARALLEEARRDFPGHAIPLLAEMLVNGEGGPADPKRAVALLSGGEASDVPEVKGALGQHYLDGKLLPRDIEKGIALLGVWASWDHDARLKFAKFLVENPGIAPSYSKGLIFDLTEESELGEPGAADALIDLKLSQNIQFRDAVGGCKLIKAAAYHSDSAAARQRPECVGVKFDGARSVNEYNASGAAFLEKGAYDLAIADFDAALRIDPNHAALRFNRGQSWRGKKEYDRAIADLNEAIRLRPGDPQTHYVRGDMWLDKNDADRAITDFDEALRLDPKNHLAIYSRGVARQSKSDYDGAMADYDAALRMEPTLSGAYFKRGEVWTEKGDYRRAIADFDESIRLDAKYAGSYAQRGRAHFYLGKFVDAQNDFGRANELEPDAYSVIWAYLARGRAGEGGLWRRLTRGRPTADPASELAARAKALDARKWPYPVVDFYLGRRSLDDMRGAAASPDETCEAYFYEGEWLLLRGDKAAAKSDLETAANTCPPSFYEHRGARAELGRMRK